MHFDKRNHGRLDEKYDSIILVLQLMEKKAAHILSKIICRLRKLRLQPSFVLPLFLFRAPCHTKIIFNSPLEEFPIYEFI